MKKQNFDFLRICINADAILNVKNFPCTWSIILGGSIDIWGLSGYNAKSVPSVSRFLKILTWKREQRHGRGVRQTRTSTGGVLNNRYELGTETWSSASTHVLLQTTKSQPLTRCGSRERRR